MDITHTIASNILIITPHGKKLDANEARGFKEKIIETISTTKCCKVVFDMQYVQFIDSSGIGALMSIFRILQKKKGEVKLANLTKTVRSIIQLVRIHKIFPIFDELNDAIRSYQ